MCIRDRFDHFAGLGWQFVGTAWTGPRVDRMLEGLARMEMMYRESRLDVRSGPWALFHDRDLPDEAKGEVMSYDADFLGLPRHVQRIRIELDSRAIAISEEQQVDLAVHALHHVVVAAAPSLGSPAPSSSQRAAAFVPAPGSFGEDWVDTIWPEGNAIEAALAVSQFALLGAGEDLADSGTAYVSRALGHEPPGLLALSGERLRLFQRAAPQCGCRLESGELLRQTETFCDDGTRTLTCNRNTRGECQLKIESSPCTDPFQQQCFCTATDDVQYGSCNETICDPTSTGFQVLTCVNRAWTPQSATCNGCLPNESCRPVVRDPERPKLQWVNRRRCLKPCDYDPSQPAGNPDWVPEVMLRRDAAPVSY